MLFILQTSINNRLRQGVKVRLLDFLLARRRPGYKVKQESAKLVQFVLAKVLVRHDDIVKVAKVFVDEGNAHSNTSQSRDKGRTVASRLNHLLDHVGGLKQFLLLRRSSPLHNLDAIGDPHACVRGRACAIELRTVAINNNDIRGRVLLEQEVNRLVMSGLARVSRHKVVAELVMCNLQLGQDKLDEAEVQHFISEVKVKLGAVPVPAISCGHVRALKHNRRDSRIQTACANNLLGRDVVVYVKVAGIDAKVVRGPNEIELLFNVGDLNSVKQMVVRFSAPDFIR